MLIVRNSRHSQTEGGRYFRVLAADPRRGRAPKGAFGAIDLQEGSMRKCRAAMAAQGPEGSIDCLPLQRLRREPSGGLRTQSMMLGLRSVTLAHAIDGGNADGRQNEDHVDDGLPHHAGLGVVGLVAAEIAGLDKCAQQMDG